jgi:hypothetical protein
MICIYHFDVFALKLKTRLTFDPFDYDNPIKGNGSDSSQALLFEFSTPSSLEFSEQNMALTKPFISPQSKDKNYKGD